MFGRLEVQTNDIDQLLGELRMFRKFEGLPAMRLQPIVSPHLLLVDAAFDRWIEEVCEPFL